MVGKEYYEAAGLEPEIPVEAALALMLQRKLPRTRAPGAMLASSQFPSAYFSVGGMEQWCVRACVRRGWVLGWARKSGGSFPVGILEQWCAGAGVRHGWVGGWDQAVGTTRPLVYTLLPHPPFR